MTIIGDVHGLVDRYWKILQKLKGPSVQLGDFGFREQHEWHRKHVDARKHRVLFGNHDHYPMLHAPHSLGNWHLENGVLYLRGARSIDREHRIEGQDWWPEEELTYAEGGALLDWLPAQEVRAVVSHDCPQYVMEALFGHREKSRTGQLLDAVWKMARPQLWVFGHHHQSRSEELDGTRFRCLAELEVLEL